MLPGRTVARVIDVYIYIFKLPIINSFRGEVQEAQVHSKLFEGM